MTSLDRLLENPDLIEQQVPLEEVPALMARLARLQSLLAARLLSNQTKKAHGLFQGANHNWMVEDVARQDERLSERLGTLSVAVSGVCPQCGSDFSASA